jgi:Spy/CpxP family protein refolding chaperone
MKKLSSLSLRFAGVIALVTSLSLSAFAQGSGRNTVFPPGLAEARLIKEMPEEVGVDEEMLEKLEKLVEEIRAKDKELEGKLIEARRKVMAMLDEARPDEKKLMAAVGVSNGLARQARELRIGASLRIRALLSDEQLEKFMEIRAKAMEKRSKPGRKRGGRPRPPAPADGCRAPRPGRGVLDTTGSRCLRFVRC